MLLYEDVAVCTAKPERVNSCDKGPVFCFVKGLLLLLDWALDFGIDGADVDGWYEAVVLHHEDHLGERRNPGRRFHVPKVGLDAPDGEPLRAARGHENLVECVRLNRVSHRSACPVRFDVADILRRNVSPCKHFLDELGLRLGRGRCEGESCVSIVIGLRSKDNRVDVVLVTVCVVEALECENPTSLGTDVSVGILVKWSALACRGVEVGNHNCRRKVLFGEKVRAACKAEVALARLEVEHRVRDGAHCPSTRRVNGHRRSHETVGVRDPVGDHAWDDSCWRVPCEEVRCGNRCCEVFAETAPDKASRLGSFECRGDNTCILKAFPRAFKQVELLRIQLFRFVWREVEELTVKSGYVPYVPSTDELVAVIEPPDGCTDGVLALGEVIPVRVEILNAIREADPDADNRYFGGRIGHA